MTTQAGIIADGHEAYVASEKIKYGASVFTSTFVPYLGMTLKGDHSNAPFNLPNAQMYYAAYALATSKPQTTISEDAFRASHADHGEEYQRMAYKVVPKANYEFVASLKKALWLQNKQRKQQEAFIANAGDVSQTGINPYALLNSPENPYMASVPAGGNDNAAQVVGPLTQIPFIQDVMGFPNPHYYINQLTTKRALPQLHAEQPETD